MARRGRPRKNLTEKDIDDAVTDFEARTGLNFDDANNDDDLLDILASYAAGTDEDVLHEVVDPQMLDRSRAA